MAFIVFSDYVSLVLPMAVDGILADCGVDRCAYADKGGLPGLARDQKVTKKSIKDHFL